MKFKRQYINDDINEAIIGMIGKFHAYRNNDFETFLHPELIGKFENLDDMYEYCNSIGLDLTEWYYEEK